MVGRSRRQHLSRPPLSVLRLLRLRIPALLGYYGYRPYGYYGYRRYGWYGPRYRYWDAAPTASGTELASALAVVRIG